jgi:mannitol/fructose-specific phosphotransferase system IIA component (Ntr-type)
VTPLHTQNKGSESEFFFKLILDQANQYTQLMKHLAATLKKNDNITKIKKHSSDEKRVSGKGST